MINVRLENTKPNVGVRNFSPNVRVSNFQTTRSGDGLIATGTPIGLLLVLTYAQNANIAFYGDQRPSVRIAAN